MFIDLSKPIDTFDHKILLRKMEIYGVGGITLKWFEDYLTNRKQYIPISNIKNTDLKDVVCRVPQRSILSLLLFLIYIYMYIYIYIYIYNGPSICFKFIRHHYAC